MPYNQEVREKETKLLWRWRLEVVLHFRQTSGRMPLKSEAPGSDKVYNITNYEAANPSSNPPLRIFCLSDEVLQSWQNEIPSEHLLRKHHSICELHFKEDDVVKDFVHHVMPDGSIYRLQKQRPSLKKGSIPCKFLNENIENTVNKSANAYYAEFVILPNTYVCSLTALSQEIDTNQLNALLIESNENKEVDNGPKNATEEYIEMEKQNNKSITNPLLETNSVSINASFYKRRTELQKPDVAMVEKSNHFKEICDSLMQNTQSIDMPSTWLP
ncbi:hypothetical protein TSAR_013397 [Trichomalopsis sarcophagae]|uniref:THAP-type domain-containing protein n=1 Tax=Trichomalopsis sarcophagae TaxID=543379 RepID=A0A232ED67_9HYME|nr:hypothetical protein TSAR_013397 [Trichomalopsis sarcophagae]